MEDRGQRGAGVLDVDVDVAGAQRAIADERAAEIQPALDLQTASASRSSARASSPRMICSVKFFEPTRITSRAGPHDARATPRGRGQRPARPPTRAAARGARRRLDRAPDARARASVSAPSTVSASSAAGTAPRGSRSARPSTGRGRCTRRGRRRRPRRQSSRCRRRSPPPRECRRRSTAAPAAARPAGAAGRGVIPSASAGFDERRDRSSACRPTVVRMIGSSA